MNAIREGGNAVIVRHCAVFGVSREPVRTFKVWPVERYAQYERTVTVHYVKPGKRKKNGASTSSMTISPMSRSNRTTISSTTAGPRFLGIWKSSVRPSRIRQSEGWPEPDEPLESPPIRYLTAAEGTP